MPSFLVPQLSPAVDGRTRTGEKKLEAISRRDWGDLNRHNCQNVDPILSRDSEIKRGKAGQTFLLCAILRSGGSPGMQGWLSCDLNVGQK